MVIRGAPAIGVAAAMGIALGMRKSKATGTQKFAAEFYKICELMAATRPTAVNLFWAIERMKRCVRRGRRRRASRSIRSRIGSSARPRRSTTRTSPAAARWAPSAPTVVPDDARILTHCNAGALATAGYGTALGVIRGAVEQGKHVTVFADETRPFLQGARLTAWELVRDGIETTVITDNMAGSLMRQGQIDLVVVGADRIAANGDTANKIGTYTRRGAGARARGSVLCRGAASTIDLNTPDGDAHSDRRAQRARGDAHRVGSQLTPEARSIWNPAFDVTPHRFIAGIITERGIFRRRTRSR